MPELVAGRACGPCNVCCSALTIEDPALTKLQGVRCPNSQPDGGCAIYETRPDTCRSFFCGWRRLKWVKEALRPDTSGVLVRLIAEAAGPGEPPRLGVVISLLTNDSLKAEGLAETVAAAVGADVPVFLHVPGPPGYTASQTRINHVLEDAVRNRDKAAVLDILRRARAKGKAGKHVPITRARLGKAGGTG